MLLDEKEFIERQYEERFNIRKWVGYTYYDTPDGEDLHLKLGFATKLGLLAAIGIGVRHGYVSYPFATNTKERFYRACIKGYQFVLAPNVYTFVTYLSTTLRKKDDSFNHFLGGIAAGGVVGAANRSPFLGVTFGLLFGCIGAAQKYAVASDIELFPQRPKKYHSSGALRVLDTTMIRDDIRGNWAREPAK